MNTLALVLQGLLGLVYLGSGGSKLAATDQMVDDFERFGYPRWFLFVTGGIEVTAAIGLLVGIWQPVWAAAGAAAIVVTMIGAVATHLGPAGDPVSKAVPPLLLGTLAAIVAWVQWPL
jgi:uncharacterized membrane protein YphA (DoxX/SURF4 family)